jgi:hypothetical protein
LTIILSLKEAEETGTLAMKFVVRAVQNGHYSAHYTVLSPGEE